MLFALQRGFKRSTSKCAFRPKPHKSVLPNSSGSFVGVSAKARWGFESPTGVFGASDIQPVRSADSLPQDRERSTVLTMSLAKQNSLFGSSDTVQPAGMYVQMLIRYAA